MKIILSVLLLSFLCFYASGQAFLNERGIVLFKLIKMRGENIFALSETSIIIKGTKYNLGEASIFMTTAEMIIDSALFGKIRDEAINHDVSATKLFRDSIEYSSTDEINYGGEIFVSNRIPDDRKLDTIFIAYNIKAKFIFYDSANGRKIIFKRLHCYGNGNTVSYPVFTPLNIKKYYMLKKRQISKLSFRRAKIQRYVYRGCD
ncbi:hypothetical protein [Algoriphagus sp. Y33]|uniref:hypothetical protein n=1 Tax=Algoriphagus sp. Y33 TaxID=2772483 RepID=UPI0017852E9D|nr:hypothetical protein [Algoriphagus sp. Y33]